MNRHTWACFSCRSAQRRGAKETKVLCPSCGAPCERLGTRIPVPPKGEAKAWKQVRAHLGEVRARQAKALKERLAYEKALLERQIAKLAALPGDPGRSKQLGLLRKRLAQLTPE